jgi:hypothetical protein
MFALIWLHNFNEKKKFSFIPITLSWKRFSSFAVKFWHLYKPDDSNWTLIIVNWYVW